MQETTCAACQAQVPKSQAFTAEGRTFCASCLKELRDGLDKNETITGFSRIVDPTVCVHCAADNGAVEWPHLGGVPTCDKCTDFFRHRPFPQWLKVSAAVFLLVAIVAFVHNWRFFIAYVEYLRGLRALEQQHVESGIELLDSAAKRLPEVPDLAVLPNLLIAQQLIVADKNEEALKLLAKSRSRVPNSILPAYQNAEFSAQMGVAFNRGDYDAFLQAAKAFAEANPNESAAIGSVASAYACKFAQTGDPVFRDKCLEELRHAHSLADADNDAFREYENRIDHRLESKEIITREEFVKRFPKGWKAGDEP
jgi:tetratricopeptide (TPR) repeat protein